MPWSCPPGRRTRCPRHRWLRWMVSGMLIICASRSGASGPDSERPRQASLQLEKIGRAVRLDLRVVLTKVQHGTLAEAEAKILGANKRVHASHERLVERKRSPPIWLATEPEIRIRHRPVRAPEVADRAHLLRKHPSPDDFGLKHKCLERVVVSEESCAGHGELVIFADGEKRLRKHAQPISVPEFHLTGDEQVGRDHETRPEVGPNLLAPVWRTVAQRRSALYLRLTAVVG